MGDIVVKAAFTVNVPDPADCIWAATVKLAPGTFIVGLVPTSTKGPCESVRLLQPEPRLMVVLK